MPLPSRLSAACRPFVPGRLVMLVGLPAVEPADPAAWALDTAGRRVAQVEVRHQDGLLTLELDQRRHPSIYWELALEQKR